MPGEIHGIISREDAWQGWAPYGERVIGGLDASLDIDVISVEDVIQIAQGVNRTEFEELYEHHQYYDALIQAAEEDKLHPATKAILYGSYLAQQAAVETLRAQTWDNDERRIMQLVQGAEQLRQEGLLTAHNIDSLQQWLVAPDGRPYMQQTPLSFLEYGRYVRRTLHSEPVFLDTAATDFVTGTVTINNSRLPLDMEIMEHDKGHELAHAHFSGLELYDITDSRAQRCAAPAVIGHNAIAPNVLLQEGALAPGAIANYELNEGWADYIACALMRVRPELGTAAEGEYGPFADVIGDIFANHRPLYHVLTDAAMVEASPQHPTAKREALAAMHTYADKVLGENNALNNRFQPA